MEPGAWHEDDEGEEEEEEEEEGEEEDEEEDEEEPILKYQRLGASVPELLQRDAAACMCVSDKLLALGTKGGKVHLLDFNGNEVSARRSGTHDT